MAAKDRKKGEQNMSIMANAAVVATAAVLATAPVNTNVTICPQVVTCGTEDPYDVSSYEDAIRQAVTDGMTTDEALDNAIIWIAENLTPKAAADEADVLSAKEYLDAGTCDEYGYAVVFMSVVQSIPFSDGVVDWTDGDERFYVDLELEDDDNARFGGSSVWNSCKINGVTRLFDVYTYDATGDSDMVHIIEVSAPATA